MDGATMAAEEHRLQKLFHELDANKDGRIDIHELTEGLHKIGYSHITEEQILELMRKSDVSKSGDLDLHEFVTYLTEHEKQLKIVFSTLDEDKDGKINVNEVMGAFKRLGIIITELEAKSLMQRYVFIYSISIDLLFDVTERCTHWEEESSFSIVLNLEKKDSTLFCT